MLAIAFPKSYVTDVFWISSYASITSKYFYLCFRKAATLKCKFKIWLTSATCLTINGPNSRHIGLYFYVAMDND